ncbi:MAG: response regulator transcription factor [Alloprevotella sp.]|nr:response regulator transcription factor [Bacteroidales bacterium]MDY2606232.1 response regulator transcription factor [Alloprevotella sp.]MCI6104688.1 response regulator transcription factor [Bacteroidales bacterium]MCI6251513.1 response regulator transcription factor [Bacteroidales bacterium]MCI7645449.1 response regulator transcription factor [Bacteroidales bacterium]
MAKKLLIVDDEPDLREILQFNLESAGYEVDAAASAEEALALLGPTHALILLDVMMGGMSGFRMAEKVRRELHSDIPIIFLTAKGSENDMLTGFSSGADDYIAKPFSVHEVLARVKAVLRRAHGDDSTVPVITQGSISVDSVRKVAQVGGQDIRLSPKEFGILWLLVSHVGRVFSREEILAHVWHGEAYVLDRTVDVHVARIRRKLGDEGYRIVNRQGYGYCFE